MLEYIDVYKVCMILVYMKGRVNITMDPELHKEAQEKFLNISGIAESALREKLGKISLDIDKSTECDFCDNIGIPLASRDNPEGLCWLYPDERWICNHCLLTKGRYITK